MQILRFQHIYLISDIFCEYLLNLRFVVFFFNLFFLTDCGLFLLPQLKHFKHNVFFLHFNINFRRLIETLKHIGIIYIRSRLYVVAYCFLCAFEVQFTRSKDETNLPLLWQYLHYTYNGLISNLQRYIFLLFEGFEYLPNVIAALIYP